MTKLSNKKRPDKTCTLAVIGAGLTGTAFLCSFVKRYRNSGLKTKLWPIEPRIIFFDRNATAGPGMPYDETTQYPFHLVNMPASEMGVDPDNPEDLTNWISSQADELKNDFPMLNPVFPPRAVVGRYLTDRFLTAVKTAYQSGIKIDVKEKTTVTHIRMDAGQYVLSTRKNESDAVDTFKAERIFLATGHWNRPVSEAQPFEQSWPAPRLREKIRPGMKTAVIGTSLSAIDTLFTLAGDAGFRTGPDKIISFIPDTSTPTITLCSRNGRLPRVRGNAGTYQNRYFTAEGINGLSGHGQRAIPLNALFTLLEKELRHAYKGDFSWGRITCDDTPVQTLSQDVEFARHGDNPDGDIRWQTVLFQAIPELKKAYLMLDTKDKQRFDHHYKSLFMAHASPIPLLNAKKILALFNAGTAGILKLGMNYKIDFISDSTQIICEKDTGEKTVHTFSMVVDARGQATDYTENSSELARQLISDGIVTTGRHTSGGILIDPETYRVLSPLTGTPDQPLENMYAAGVMTGSRIINVSMARECVHAADTIARGIVRQIERKTP